MYNAPQNAPRAPRAEYNPFASYQTYHVPTNIYIPQAPRADSWPTQAPPQMAPRAPQAMRTPPTTPPQASEAFNNPQAPRFPELSSLAGEVDAASRFAFQQAYTASTGPSIPTLYGLNTINFSHPGTVQQPIDGGAYYQTLQDYHQWRTSDPSLNAYYIGPPEPEEVLRHGMILRFLDSLPPTPPDPAFPPDPPQLLRRTRRRRTTRSSDDYGSSSRAGPSEEAAAAEDAAQGNAESAQGGQGKRNRRGRRGRRGKGGEKSEESVAIEEVEGGMSEEADDELTEEVQNEVTEEVQNGLIEGNQNELTEEAWDELTKEDAQPGPS
ncbi:hypothetical protein V8C34DRAFT_290041, partial [Trichoderma compactum]